MWLLERLLILSTVVVFTGCAQRIPRTPVAQTAAETGSSIRYHRAIYRLGDRLERCEPDTQDCAGAPLKATVHVARVLRVDAIDEALGFDGGGSSALFVDNRIVNALSGKGGLGEGVERVVASHIGVCLGKNPHP